MIRWICEIHGSIDTPATLTGDEQACPICCTGIQLKRKPRIYRQDNLWWVDCKHGDRTGPYRSRVFAFLAANYIATPSYERRRNLKGAR